jgi:hypothetical protein
LLRGEALRWYNTLEPAVKTNWDQLERAFVNEFKAEGTGHKVLQRISELRMRSSDTLRGYAQKVQRLVDELSTEPRMNLQIEWFVGGLPSLLDWEVRKAEPQTLAQAVAVAKKFEKTAMSSGEWGEKKKKKVSFEISEESSDDLNGSGSRQRQSKEDKVLAAVKQEIR